MITLKLFVWYDNVYMFKQKVLCVDIKGNLNLAIAYMPMFHPEVLSDKRLMYTKW